MCTQYSRLKQPALAPDSVVFAGFGAVGRPRFFTLEDLSALPQTTRRVTLVCRHTALNPGRWDTRMWTGVAVADLAAELDVNSSAQSVEVAGYDGSVRSFPLAKLKDAILALQGNGQPLTPKEGAPARLIVPGLAACEMPRFVQRVTFRAESTPETGLFGPIAVFERAEPMANGLRLHGMALGAATVVVRRDGGAAVIVPVVGAAPGLAGRWILAWPDETAASSMFTVDVAHEALVPEARPVARKWKPRAHHWTMSGSATL